MDEVKATDPAFNVVPDTISGGYEDVNGDVKNITLNLQYPENEDSTIKAPISKREYFALKCLHSLLVNNDYISMSREEKAYEAVTLADALIAQLNTIPIP